MTTLRGLFILYCPYTVTDIFYSSHHIAVLEGGYDLTALASSAVAHCEVLSAGYAALSKSDDEAIVEKGAQPSSPSDHSHLVRDTTANRSAEDEDCEKSYGGDEAAALAAHIASLDLGPSIRRP